MEELNIEQVLEVLKKSNIISSAQMVRKWLREGRIKGLRNTNQRSWRISKNDLDEFISQQLKERGVKRECEYSRLKVMDILELKQSIKTPIYHRGFIWKAAYQSNFITTLLQFGNSISTVYLAEDGAGYLLIDGRQRIESILKFADNQYKLTSDDCTNLKNKRFKDLCDDMQQRFLNATVNTGIVKNYDLDDMKELYVRLNSHTPA